MIEQCASCYAMPLACTIGHHAEDEMQSHQHRSVESRLQEKESKRRPPGHRPRVLLLPQPPPRRLCSLAASLYHLRAHPLHPDHADARGLSACKGRAFALERKRGVEASDANVAGCVIRRQR